MDIRYSGNAQSHLYSWESNFQVHMWPMIHENVPDQQSGFWSNVWRRFTDRWEQCLSVTFWLVIRNIPLLSLNDALATNCKRSAHPSSAHPSRHCCIITKQLSHRADLLWRSKRLWAPCREWICIRDIQGGNALKVVIPNSKLTENSVRRPSYRIATVEETRATFALELHCWWNIVSPL